MEIERSKKSKRNGFVSMNWRDFLSIILNTIPRILELPLTIWNCFLRNELAELEPTTRGAKGIHHQQTFHQEQTNDVQLFENGAADNVTDMDTTQHGEGLASENKELFSVQHQGSYSLVYTIGVAFECSCLTISGSSLCA